MSSSTETILKQLHAALGRDPRIHLHRYPIRIDLSADGNLFLEGEVENVEAKKRTLALAGSLAAGMGERPATGRCAPAPRPCRPLRRTLHGIVPREAEKQAAELDAWCLSGVKNVVNDIEVRK